jgi:hypothetical protein
MFRGFVRESVIKASAGAGRFKMSTRTKNIEITKKMEITAVSSAWKYRRLAVCL